MKLINEILFDKKQGMDCTEDESAYIKGWLRATTIRPEDGSQQVLEDIQLLFPLEYGEYLDEMEAAPSTPVEDKQTEADVIPEVLAEVREYTNLPIMLTDVEFAPNHLFCVRGKYCEFTELTNVVQVYVYPTYQKEKQTEPNKQPLYKVLNERRTQGEWKQCKISSISFAFSYEVEDKNGNTILDAFNNSYYRNLPNGREAGAINAQYTALAVNNLHILAEALENILNHSDDAEAKRLAKQALNNIS